MSFMSEFKEFAVRGNAMDLAVGVVIGASFGKIVSSLVDGVIMPPIGLLIGGVDFSEWKLVLQRASPEHEEVAIMIGSFLNTIIQFIIVALAIFLVIRLMNSLSRKKEAEPEEPAAPDADTVLLTEIRDLLSEQRTRS